MQIIVTEASPALVAAVNAYLLPRMVAALLKSNNIDLSDELACIIRLSCAGFGASAIATLLPDARKQAEREGFRLALLRGLH